MVFRKSKRVRKNRKSRKNYRGGDVISDVIKARIHQEEDIDPTTGEVIPKYMRYVDIANDIMDITEGHGNSFFSIYYDTALEHRAYRPIAKELKRLRSNQENEQKRFELEAKLKKQEHINSVKRNLQYKQPIKLQHTDFQTEEEIADKRLMDNLLYPENSKRQGYFC